MKDENTGFNWFLGTAIVVILLLVAWGTFSNDNSPALDVNEFAAAVGISVGNAMDEKLANYFLATNTGEDVSDSETDEVVTNSDNDTGSNDWEALAWEQVLDEFEHEDEFYTCGGHEYDDDEYDFDIEDITVKLHKNGDVTVTLDPVEFDFEDNSDNPDCKVDRAFVVFWDDDDVEDEDWDEAEVTWLRAKVEATA